MVMDSPELLFFTVAVKRASPASLSSTPSVAGLFWTQVSASAVVPVNAGSCATLMRTVLKAPTVVFAVSVSPGPSSLSFTWLLETYSAFRKNVFRGSTARFARYAASAARCTPSVAPLILLGAPVTGM